MNEKKLMEIAVLAGEKMLSAGAETYRVEDTICRILKISNWKRTEAFVTMTGIIVTLEDSSKKTFTTIRRVRQCGTDLQTICRVNMISRQLCNKTISIHDAKLQLLQLHQEKRYSTAFLFGTVTASTFFFVILLGGSGLECILALGNGCIFAGMMLLQRKLAWKDIIRNLFAAMCISFFSMYFGNLVHFASEQIDIVVAGSIMPMVPGVAITNAIRDTLQGDYIAGMARAIEAIVIASSIAVGVGIGLFFFFSLMGGVV